MVASSGATPWPQITSTDSRVESQSRIGASPPGPFIWGSTTCSAKPAAAAASKALPPFSSMAMPAAVASQWVVATTPKLPRISGLVVNSAIWLPRVLKAGTISAGLWRGKAGRNFALTAGIARMPAK